MVRRDENPDRLVRAGLSCCTVPAGASPVPISAGAPGSRPQAWGETPVSRAGCRKPLRREQVRGPQHEVKPAASKQKQSGGRAAHVTAKVTPPALDPERAGGPGGVWGAARGQGVVRNTRGPSSRPWSRRAVPYKPMAKAGGAERESEGVVVPLIPAQNNAGGGKGPWGDRVGGGGKREGMSGQLIRTNHPQGHSPLVKARQLQHRLWSGAKRFLACCYPFGGASRRDGWVGDGGALSRSA